VLLAERYIVVLPATHPLVARKTVSAAALRDEPFVLFAQAAGPRAHSRTVAVCEEHGFRPKIVQEAPQWLTVLRLVGAGFGVTIAPACVRQVATPEVVCLPLRTRRGGSDHRSTIELAYRSDEVRPTVRGFAEIARRSFGQA
jgi:DNA-binding transcriptional LysR family regulator